MKNLLVISLLTYFLLPTNIVAISSAEVIDVCQDFVSGAIDAYETLEALELDFNDFSIGVNNTAKIFCS
tara:strand:- start:468 stop:674 length:207 start_codon:yes stop_codon:yes gene_type:complete